LPPPACCAPFEISIFVLCTTILAQRPYANPL
jgi:hypothetical protein